MKKLLQIICLSLSVLLTNTIYSNNLKLDPVDCLDAGEVIYNMLREPTGYTYQTNAIAQDNHWTEEKFQWYLNVYEAIAQFTTSLMNNHANCSQACMTALSLANFDMSDLEDNTGYAPNVQQQNLNWYQNVQQQCGL